MAATEFDSLIADKLLTELQTKTYGTPALPYSLPDLPFDPATDPNGYLAVSVLFNAPDAQSVSGSMTQHKGFLQVAVMYPKNKGLIKPVEIASAIRKEWKIKKTLYTTGIRISVYAAPYITGPIYDDTRTQYPVFIPWEAVEYT